LEFARRAAFARIVGVEDRQIAEVAVVQESVRFAAVSRALAGLVVRWSGS